ncbi:hypothetical protein AXG93_4003s1420 [Marchantia polymorpha subsp. ruderalis]|uniref:Uncharacterized protein n=1 Tax=Marchantia polymorpha subsp. ruderalis TaxID=1480154 RepID=A0A176W9B6_MARPO|nr:hypothetical protein AXG93_4003s1420 [Marchantia polymorpha subsp. ruderalis]
MLRACFGAHTLTMPVGSQPKQRSSSVWYMDWRIRERERREARYGRGRQRRARRHNVGMDCLPPSPVISSLSDPTHITKNKGATEDEEVPVQVPKASATATAPAAP